MRLNTCWSFNKRKFWAASFHFRSDLAALNTAPMGVWHWGRTVHPSNGAFSEKEKQHTMQLNLKIFIKPQYNEFQFLS